VEGRLWGKPLSVEIETECAHCGRALHLTLSRELEYSVREKDADPLVFSPDIDWERFRAPNIIEDL